MKMEAQTATEIKEEQKESSFLFQFCIICLFFKMHPYTF